MALVPAAALDLRALRVRRWTVALAVTLGGSSEKVVRDTGIVSTAQSLGCIDAAGLFAAGFSNGSALVLALACDPQSPFSRYGAVAGPYVSQDCAGAMSASIVYFHGMRDTRVPYAGAETVIGPMPAVDDTVAWWVAHDRSPAVGATTTATGVLRHYAWRGCADQSAISVYLLEDAGHQWPVSDVDATGLMWQFFTSVER